MCYNKPEVVEKEMMKMANGQNRTEIILEEIKGSVKAIADGHIQLGQQMERGFREIREELGTKIDDIAKTVRSHSDILKSHTEQLDDIQGTVNEFDSNLKHHMRQNVPPAHIAV
ncbi:MAG: hypothetical protein ABIE84_05405 [bacterium]